MKKAQKRLGKSGVRTHDPKWSEIYLIKTQISMLLFSKGRNGPWSSSVPTDTLEFDLFRVKVWYLRSFEKNYHKHLKNGKKLKKVLKNQNPSQSLTLQYSDRNTNLHSTSTNKATNNWLEIKDIISMYRLV